MKLSPSETNACEDPDQEPLWLDWDNRD